MADPDRGLESGVQTLPERSSGGAQAGAMRRWMGPVAAVPVAAAIVAGGLLAAGAITPAWALGGLAAVSLATHLATARQAVRRVAAIEQERHDSEERHRAFRRSAGIGMFDWDLSQPHATGTPEYFAMMGMPRDKGTFTKEEWAAHVHPDDLERAAAAVEALISEGRPYDIEFRTFGPDGDEHWYANRAVLFRTREGKPARILGAMLDIDDLKRTEAMVRERERMFRRMADDAPVMIWLTDREARVTFLSRAYYRFTGLTEEEALQGGWMSIVHPDDRETLQAVWEQANDRREHATLDVRVRRHDGVYHWMLVTASPRFDGEAFAGFIGSLVDISDRKVAEERHALLMREVDHRAKNVLALVISVLRVTRADSLEGYIAAVEGRVEAMARAHALLAESRWYGANLRRLVEDELGSHLAPEGRITVDGPATTVLANAVQPLTIVLHELVTNAAKHGALASREGRLTVSWWRTGEGGLTLEWRENAGRAVAAPSRHGFGRMLMETLVGRQLGGSITFSWPESGLSCRVVLPAALVTTRPATAPDDGAADGPETVPPPEGRPGKRVLVVEDDVLVALGLEQILDELKYEVLGPVYSVEEALAMLEAERPDAALLDVNLGGVISTAVARRLRQKGVRFAYCTGYGDPDGQEVEAPTLIKPVSAGQLSKMMGALTRPAAPPGRAQPVLSPSFSVRSRRDRGS